MSLPKRWQWLSCVCHRRKVVDHPSSVAFYKFNRSLWPWEDACLKGRLCYCEQDPIAETKSPNGCFIGVRGWLLTCRKAYTEAVHILFATNTFYISSLPLLLNISRLLPEQNLNAITSLQLALGTHDLPPRAEDPLLEGLWEKCAGDTGCALGKLCDMIPKIFPNVQRLDVFLQSWLVPPRHVHSDDALGVMERDVLGPVTDMLYSFKLGAQLSVAIS